MPYFVFTVGDCEIRHPEIPSLCHHVPYFFKVVSVDSQFSGASVRLILTSETLAQAQSFKGAPLRLTKSATEPMHTVSVEESFCARRGGQSLTIWPRKMNEGFNCVWAFLPNDCYDVSNLIHRPFPVP